MRNAASAGDGRFSSGVPLALFVAIGLVIGRSVQKRQENGIGTQIMHICSAAVTCSGGSWSIKSWSSRFPWSKSPAITASPEACIHILRCEDDTPDKEQAHAFYPPGSCSGRPGRVSHGRSSREDKRRHHVLPRKQGKVEAYLSDQKRRWDALRKERAKSPDPLMNRLREAKEHASPGRR